jgi:oxygen-independent coproporphyrinogen-3 oxidase
LNADKRSAIQATPVAEQDLIFEFMLNALRLKDGVPTSHFTARTGLTSQLIETQLNHARQKGWLTHDAHRICTTELGQRYLNDVVAMFLP